MCVTAYLVPKEQPLIFGNKVLAGDCPGSNDLKLGGVLSVHQPQRVIQMANKANTRRKAPSAIPAPELALLVRFLLPQASAVGTVKAEMMGPGSPNMRAVGSSTGTFMVDGMWYMGDYQQEQFVGEELVLTWKVHMVIGWDEGARSYVGYFFPSRGEAAVCAGSIVGDELFMISKSPFKFADQIAKLRFDWRATSANTVSWTNEVSVANGPWQLIEKYLMTEDHAPRPT
jgi:hypothetical protein